jgi:hypothetical protein
MADFINQLFVILYNFYKVSLEFIVIHSKVFNFKVLVEKGSRKSQEKEIIFAELFFYLIQQVISYKKTASEKYFQKRL